MRIEEIDVIRDVLLAPGWREIELYNGMKGEVVPDPEWIKNDREDKPTKEHYENSVTAPTAILREEKIKMKVNYFCEGLASFDLSVTCDIDDSTGPEICPYGDMDDEETTDLSCDGDDDFDFVSKNSVDKVMATLNH